ncbi:MAG: hypothetical protein ACMZ7B_13125 [Balneola sp.]
MGLDSFIKKVDEQKFHEAASRAVLYAKNWDVESKKVDLDNEQAQRDYEIITDVAEYILKSKTDPKDQIKIFFDLYMICPSYSVISTLKIYYWKDLFESAKKEFWRNIKSILNSGKEHFIKPIEYSLWCDFFEDWNTVEESWKNLVTKDATNEVLKIILDVSGPVPFNLKKPLYSRLIRSEFWHIHIFKSLLHSEFDVYGNIDKKESLKILNRLSIDENTEHLDLLRERLQEVQN